MSVRFLSALALSALLAVAGCDDPKEQADEFYQSGMELLQQGDVDRAIVSFRNVFRHDGEHFEARSQLAEALNSQGKTQQAFSQYLRLAEQYPDSAFTMQRLSYLAMLAEAWQEAERYGKQALELDPDADANRNIRAALGYRQAAIDNDVSAKDAFAQDAAALIEEDPADLVSRRIVISHAVAGNQPAVLLAAVEPAIALYPDNLGFYLLKLRSLEQLREEAQIEDHLQAMFSQFPDNEDVQRAFVTFYLQRGRIDDAEALLRSLAGPETGDPQKFTSVLQLITRTKGITAARAEVQRLLDVNAENSENVLFFTAMLAGYDFNEGDQKKAISELQALLKDAPASDVSRRVKNMLADMFMRAGDQDAARALADEILTEDSANVGALKLRGQLLIQDDKPDDAIVALRQALEQNPRDVEILLILAAAHERNGNIRLQGERLAIAVDITNFGPRETRLYANFLLQQNRVDLARSLLSESRKRHPRNVPVLSLAAFLALSQNDRALVDEILADLERMSNDPQAAQVALALKSEVLLQQNRVDESLSLLQQQGNFEDTDAESVTLLIQTQLRGGRVAEAREYLDRVLATSPENEDLRLIDASLYLAEGNPEQSETVLRGILSDNPANLGAYLQLYKQLREGSRLQDAREVLSAGLENFPDSEQLLQHQASELITLGDYASGIALFESLYERNSSNLILANNLASALSTFSDTPEDLQRAAIVARRLRGTSIPAFQDTFGWIAYRQQDYGGALEYLLPAARSLPNDPLVQYHLGMTYLALDDAENARIRLEAAIEIAGPDTILPQMRNAREALDKLVGR